MKDVKAMVEKTSVMILGRNIDIYTSLYSDLEVLGFKPLSGNYPDIDMDDIIRKPPGIIILELAALDDGVLSVCELLLREGILPLETALVALVSENTMGQIPLTYRFTDIIRFPYDIEELGFRLRRVTHLYNQESTVNIIHIGNLSISPSRYEVAVDGEPIILSHKEYELLKYLITHPNRVITRKVLLANIWGDNITSESRTVDVFICRVRAKIGNTYIKTVRSVGYVFRLNSWQHLNPFIKSQLSDQ